MNVAAAALAVVLGGAAPVLPQILAPERVGLADSPAAASSPSGPDPLTFRAALALAVTRNLDLAAARRGRAVREAEVRAAGQYPNPEVSVETARDVPHQSLQLALPLDVFGRRTRRVALAREELTLAEVDEETALLKLRRQVRLAFYGLLAADESAALAQAATDVADRVRQAAAARVEEGAAPRLDLMQAELGLARARAERELARSVRRAAQAELNALLDRPAAEPITPAGGLADVPALPDPAQAAARAAASNVELLAAEREVAVERRRLGLLRAERLPVPVLSGGADFHAPGEFAVGGRVGLSVAVPLFSRNQGEIAGSLARIDQLAARRDAARRAVEARLAAALSRAEALRAQAETFAGTLVPTATEIESLAEESYRLGRSSVLAALDAQRSLRDVKNDALQSLLALQSALADLEDVLGGPIE